MIVAEDRITNEVVRFLVIDAYAKLGVVQYGSDIQTFDSQRMLRYYALVENQLFDYASRYPESFQYLPRRAYSYLSKPPLLGDLSTSLATTSETRWFSDQFVIHPLTEISAKPLPRYQQKTNIESCFRWTTQSEDAIRMYNVLDLDVETSERIRWAVSIDARNLSRSVKGGVRKALLDAVTERLPIFIRLEDKDEISSLLEWLVLIKESGHSRPSILLSVKEQRGWENEILKLLQMPGVHLLTSGASIVSLSTIIGGLKGQLESELWSEKLVFASSYPETQMGDSITEILSFLLSKNLGAGRDEIQNILAGNLIRILSPISKQLRMEYSESSLFAEGIFGKIALREFLRLIRLLNAQMQIQIISADIIPDSAEGQIELNSVILTTRNLKSKFDRRFILQKERDESLRIVGWKKMFDDLYSSKNWIALRTQIRASDRGPSLDAPSHISTFNRRVLDILGIRDATSVISSLHYQIQENSLEVGKISLCQEDIRAIGVKEGEVVTVLDAESDHYWGAMVVQTSECPTRTVGLPSAELRVYGLSNASQIDLVKYNDEIIDSKSILLTYRNTPGYTDSEISAYLHMAKGEIESSIQSKIIGIGTRFVTANGLELEVKRIDPNVRKGQLVCARDSDVEILPIEFLNELNLILVAANGNQMMVRDASVRNPRAIQKTLETLSNDLPEIATFLYGIRGTLSRWNVAATIILEMVNSFKHNKSEGKFGLVFVDRLPHKFTIQKNLETQEYIKFNSDMQNDEIFKSLVYSVIDAGEISDEPTDSKALFRSAAELTEDFGVERPTLMLLMLSEMDDIDDIAPYLQVLNSTRNLKLLIIGIGNQFGNLHRQKIKKMLDIDVQFIKEYSLFDLRGLLISKIRELCHS